MEHLDLLILGAGWTSQFLIPLLKSSSITYAATTTTGHESYGSPTIPFKYDPSSSDINAYSQLPSAKTILVTFPLKGPNQSNHIVSMYSKVHSGAETHNWIQLGSTGIFSAPHWNDHKSVYSTENDRAIAEDELLQLGGCVLNLAGLYGGERDPRNWVIRVAKTKDEVKAKKALHLVHGQDVARAILAVHEHFTKGERWLITDLRVYDWWDLIQDWGAEAKVRAREKLGAEAEELDYQKWVVELMVEEDVKALPRSAESLGRVLDSRAFWSAMGIWPSEATHPSGSETPNLPPKASSRSYNPRPPNPDQRRNAVGTSKPVESVRGLEVRHRVGGEVEDMVVWKGRHGRKEGGRV